MHMQSRLFKRSPIRARRARLIGPILLALILTMPGIASAKQFSEWGPAVLETGINSPQADGCPIESPNGKNLYIASNRPGAVGGVGDLNDIWVAHRANRNAPWSTPINVGAPVNSAAADFCPTPVHDKLGAGNWLLFVSSRGGPGTCGAGDMYLAQSLRGRTWSEPVHLGCDAAGTGPNFSGGEFGPSLVETDEGTFLYFSSTGPDPTHNQDIYVSRMNANGTFAPAEPVVELNTDADDFMPNVSGNGKEIVFNSNRAGGFGLQDVYTASRRNPGDAWSNVVNVGPNVNTAASETRSSLSGDGTRLHFGRNGDIYVSTRTRVD